MKTSAIYLFKYLNITIRYIFSKLYFKYIYNFYKIYYAQYILYNINIFKYFFKKIHLLAIF